MAKLSTKKIARAGVLAGLYALLSLVTFPIASGSIQFRVSEGLCLLPLFMPESIPALFIGCMVSNLITGCAIFDIIFGSLITLFSAILTYYFGKIIKNVPLKLIVGGLFPVILNAFLLPLIWYYCYGELEFLYVVQVCFLLVSQSVSVYAVGIPLYFIMKKLQNKTRLG